MQSEDKRLSLERVFHQYLDSRNVPVTFQTSMDLADEAIAVIKTWDACARCNEPLGSHAADGSCYQEGPEKYVEIY